VSEPSSGSATGAGRKFTRFAEGRTESDGYWPIPPDGLCLSSFLLLSLAHEPERVLVGKLDPAAPWTQIGALNTDRIRLNMDGWMLPSSHLQYYESPSAAAIRILREQLGLEGVPLDRPMVFSEAYRSPRHPDRARHWDLEFLYRGTVSTGWVPAHPAWKELRFIDPKATPRTEFTRAHDEILELAGFRIG
jgi:ADP-ribose pyrophosphatase YjhB (NUDIX family)